MKFKNFTKTICINLFALLLITAANQLSAQAPQIKWAKCYGGTAKDAAYDVINTADGGNIMCGSTASADGDITENKGGTDAWVVKTDADGNIVWQKSYGGGGDDYFKSVLQLSAGGYLLCGSTNSTDGDIESWHGAFDFWIVKLDESGNIVWESTYGGSSDDAGNDISSTADTGFLAVGYTFSSDGQISEYKDGGDGWLVFINANGDLLKQKTKGGKNYDEFYSVSGTVNGGYILAGKTFSNNGTVTGNHGGSDAWIARLSKLGTEQWNVLYGDTGDDGAFDVKENTDGNFSVSGWFDNGTEKNSWLYETNTSGGFISGNTHGGSGDEFAGSLLVNSLTNFTIAASSSSEMSGDKDCHLGNKDFWIYNSELGGAINWQKCMGGTLEDYSSRAIASADGSISICGYTNSTDLDVIGNHGDFDFWLVKLATGCDVSAGFGSTVTGPSASFINTSFDASDFYWTFGDGTSSTEINPTHVYSAEGTYTVCLIASSACKADTVCNEVVIACVPATAVFSYTANYTSVSYSATDANATSWSWSFGDGGSSTLQNPTHNYVLNGSYEVCLTVSNFCSSDTVCQTVNVECQPVVAGYTYVVNGTTVTFTSTSTGATNYKWKFGDSFNSNQQNPTHVYADTGTYTVCLTAYNSCLSDTLCIDIHVGCTEAVSDFSSTGADLTVTFSDLSVNATSWSWAFGDGGTSTAQNPTHVYTTSGTYDVCLTTANECSSNTICKSIEVLCPAVASGFTSSVNGFNVSFTDQSTGATAWNWSFGDGGTSTLQNPTHTYANYGTYNVCLTVNNICAESVSCQDVIIVCPAITASFEYSADAQTVIFDDLSSGSTSWSWTFGDGGTSSDQNPTYIYLNGGTYTVCLIVGNGCKSDTSCTEVQIECLPFDVSFTYVQDGNTFQFTDASGTGIIWNWTFGDGGTSTEQNPEHTYNANGFYLVCLTAYDGCSTSKYCDSVQIIGVNVPGENNGTSDLNVFPNPMNNESVISFTISSASNIEMVLNDMEGRLIRILMNEKLSVGKHTYQLERANLSSGVYMLQLKDASGVKVKRIVIE